MREIILDVRSSPAPEPFVKVMAELQVMKPGSYIKMIHRMKPQRLLESLQGSQFAFQVQELADSSFHIYIYNRKDEENVQVLSWK